MCSVCNAVSCRAYREYVSSLELASFRLPVVLVLPLEMIVEIARAHLIHVYVLTLIQGDMELIIGECIFSMVVMLEQVKHSVRGILGMSFDKEEDSNSRKQITLYKPH